MMRFGLNSFLLSSGFTMDDAPMIEQFKAWGADFIEFAIHEPEKIDTAALRRAIESAGMENCPVCGMFPPDRDLRGSQEEQQNTLDYVRRLIDLAAELGSNVVAGPFYSSVGRCNLHTESEKEQQQELVAGNLLKLCDHAEKAGITLALEPLNRFETDFINTLGQAQAIIKKVGSPVLKILADTFHMNIEEASSSKALKEAGSLVGHVHASASHRGIPGPDQVDWRGVFTTLQDLNYSGDIAIETFSTDNVTIARAASIWVQRYDSAEQLALEGLKFLRKTWKTVEG